MKYDAFISYKHEEIDMQIAKKIHNGLETYRVPKSTQKEIHKKKINQVFRDQEELPIGSDLNDKIYHALRDSNYLIVICSPNTPNSYWVLKEIDTFISLHGREKILAILVDGEPSISFPPQLLVDENGNTVEPLAADVRGNTASERNKKLKTELIRLAAPILGCSYDDLRQRHRERKLRRIASLTASCAGVVTALGISFGIYNASMVKKVEQNYTKKQIQQSKYLADVSLQVYEKGDRTTAALIALEAIQGEKNQPYVPQAEYALSNALRVYDTGHYLKTNRTLSHKLIISDYIFSEDENTIVSYDDTGKLHIWDVPTGKIISQYTTGKDNIGYVIIPETIDFYENDIICVTPQNITRIDRQGSIIWDKTASKETTNALINAEDGFAICQSVHQLNIYELSSGEIIDTINLSDHKFHGVIAYNAKKHLIVCECADDTSDSSYIFEYFTNTKKSKTINVDTANINSISVSDSGVVVVSSSDFIIDSENQTVNYSLQAFDAINGNLLWSGNDSIDNISLNHTPTTLKTREYIDDTGKHHSCVVEAIDNHIKTWDLQTGELLSQCAFSQTITSVFLGTSSEYAYVSEEGGNIYIVNLENGAILSDYTINTGMRNKKMIIRNMKLAICDSMLTNIIIMDHFDNPRCTKLLTEETNIYYLDIAKNEQYFTTKRNNTFCLYKIDGTEIGEISFDEDNYILFSGFYDNEFIIIDNAGILHQFTLDSLTENTVNYLENSEVAYANQCYFTQNGQYIVIYNDRTFYLIDLNSKEIIVSDDIPNDINKLVLSEDASTLYFSTISGFIEYDTKTLSSKSINVSDCLSSKDINLLSKKMVISSDGKIIAIGCNNDDIHILKLNDDVYKEIAVLPLASSTNCYFSFTEDNNYLLIQGDDLYLKIWSIQKDSYVYQAKEQIDAITSISEDIQMGVISINTTSGIIILRNDSFTPIANIENGVCYLSKKKSTIIVCNNTVYEIPFLSLNELVDEANCQLKDLDLTDEQRIKYYID